jgi:hypothetical protein
LRLPRLRSHSSFGQIILRRNAERVGHAIEKREERGDVNGFSDLIFFPSGIAQFLNVCVGGARGIFGDLLDVKH